MLLVSHYSAIGDTISCDAPYSAIGFRGKLFLQYPPCQVCLRIVIGHFYRKKWGCSSDSLRYHRKHSATGVLLHLSRDRGGISVGSLRLCYSSGKSRISEALNASQIGIEFQKLLFAIEFVKHVCNQI